MTLLIVVFLGTCLVMLLMSAGLFAGGQPLERRCGKPVEDCACARRDAGAACEAARGTRHE